MESFDETDRFIQRYNDLFKHPANRYYFPSDASEGAFLRRELDFAKHSFQQSNNDPKLLVSVLNRCSHIYALCSHYNAVDAKGWTETFSHSLAYGCLAIRYAKENLINKDDEPLSQEWLAYQLLMIVVADWTSEVEYTTEQLSLFVQKVITTSQSAACPDIVHPVLSFGLMLLQASAKTQPRLELDNSLTYPYPSMIAHWDTTDLKEVDRYVILACEARIALVAEGDNFTTAITQFLPFDVLAWLTLRSKNGLSNPPMFSHPLMKLDLVKQLLEKTISRPDPSSLLFQNS